MCEGTFFKGSPNNMEYIVLDDKQLENDTMQKEELQRNYIISKILTSYLNSRNKLTAIDLIAVPVLKTALKQLIRISKNFAI